jgi:2-polyprenyl-3-methyl-5-hydroxy-6-metoxy-1,4-benzoquinol methylase
VTISPIPSRDAAYFAALYGANPDPWNFSGSFYERQKYQATIAALQGMHFNRAFEIGCSIGVLTQLLAPQCDFLLAADIVETALADARRRCAALPQVNFANLRVPEQWAAGPAFDLILCSEILYFLSPSDIVQVAHQILASLTPSGTVLLVNYTEPIDEPCGGDQAADIFIAAVSETLLPAYQQREAKYRIDRLQVRATAR